MTKTVSIQDSNPPQYNIGATGIGTQRRPITPGHIVVNPPHIKPYSFYDEIKVDKQFYKELINPKSKAFYYKPMAMKTQKPKNTLKKLLIGGILIGCSALAFAKRNLIKTFLIDSYDKIKKYIKRK